MFCEFAGESARLFPPPPASQRSLSADRPISAPVPDTMTSSDSISAVPAATPAKHRHAQAIAFGISSKPACSVSRWQRLCRCFAPSPRGCSTGMRDSMIGPAAFTTAGKHNATHSPPRSPTRRMHAHHSAAASQRHTICQHSASNTADSSRLGEMPKAGRHSTQIALTRKSLEALEKNVGGRVNVELHRDVRAWIPPRHLRHDVAAARVDRRNHLAVDTNRGTQYAAAGQA